MTTRAERLKSLRIKAGLNQQQVADYIHKSRSRIAIYETQPQVQIPYEVLQKLAGLYKTTPEFIEGGGVSTSGRNSAAMPAAYDGRVNGVSVRPLAVTVDNTGKENIVFVPVKARAGYLLGYGDPEFIQSLYACSLPGFVNGTYRIFEVEGDSMSDTLQPGDLVITSYVENWNDLKNENVYVVVAQDGIVIKRVQNMIEKAAGIVILSDNPQYTPDFIPIDQVSEIWEAKSLLTNSFARRPSGMLQQEIHALRSIIDNLNLSSRKNGF
jgi:transcriptional regulator with XRE-family HTH domain